MKINLLKAGYKNNEEFYRDFIRDDLKVYDETYISQDCVMIEQAPDFPVYLARNKNKEKKQLFLQMITTMQEYFMDLEREYMLDELFWHSYFCIYKREYLITTYPQIVESQSEFERIVTRQLDWGNYIYKAVLAYDYVNEYVEPDEYNKYYELIIENMDLFNYIIKYQIFRNGRFLINLLSVVEETKTAKIAKSKIINRPDLGTDERYGRRVIYEFNKSYPVVLAPMLDKEDLKTYYLKFLGMYYQEKIK